MSAQEWLANDSLFKQELWTGHQYAQTAADLLRFRGISCSVTPMNIRDSVDDRHRYSDEFDLIAERRRVEVKSRDVAFTSPDDFPYGDVFVYSKRGWMAKSHKPVAIIVISQRTCQAVVIPVSSESSWTSKYVHDRVRNIDYEVLMVKRDYLRSIDEFSEWLLS